MVDVRVKREQGDFLVDVAFRAGGAGVTALFGESGAGKSSVINMVAGLLNPDEGRIVVGGRTLFDSRRRVSVPPDKRRVGYIFQDSRLFPHLSVRSNLIYGMKRTPVEDRFVKYDDVVDMLDIGKLTSRRPSKLSGGEKQRVAIGRALLTSPKILLMDEPLASLDSSRKEEVLKFIIPLPETFSVPIIYVTHDHHEMMRLADTVVYMKDGRVEDVKDISEKEVVAKLVIA